MLRILVVSVITALAAGPTAQVSVSATTVGTGLRATVGGSVTQVPAGATVTAGSSLSPHVDFFQTSPSAQTRFSATLRARAASNWPTGQFSSGTGSIELELTSAIPIVANVSITVMNGSVQTNPLAQADAEVIGSGSVATSACTGATPCDASFVRTIDSNGIKVRLNVTTRALFGPNAARTVFATAKLDVAAVPCATGYGTECGLELAAFSDIYDVEQVVDVTARNGSLTFGVLLVGAQMVDLPTPFGCDLYVADFVGIPLALGPGNITTLRFRPPGVQLGLQAFSFDGNGLLGSNGLWFDCR